MVEHDRLGNISNKLDQYLKTKGKKIQFYRKTKRYYSQFHPFECRGTFVDWYFKIDNGDWMNAGEKTSLIQKLTKAMKAGL